MDEDMVDSHAHSADTSESLFFSKVSPSPFQSLSPLILSPLSLSPSHCYHGFHSWMHSKIVYHLIAAILSITDGKEIVSDLLLYTLPPARSLPAATVSPCCHGLSPLPRSIPPARSLPPVCPSSTTPTRSSTPWRTTCLSRPPCPPTAMTSSPTTSSTDTACE